MDIISFIGTLLAYALLLVPCLRVSFALDSISQSQILSDGTNLVSSDGTFELGFFSPANSNKRYLGIWLKNIPVQTIVWVANRANPINDSNGILTLSSTGNLVLTHNGTLVWDITKSLKQHVQINPVVAQLLNSGNLVVRNENDPNPENYFWQGFDYPTDTGLAGMKFGWDRKTGLNRKFTAWKSPEDPAPGDFSWCVVLHNYPDIYMMKGTEKYQRVGPWNGLHFSGTPEVRPNPVFNYSFISNRDETYSTWPQDYCDTYGLCGANGYCIITESPVCQCLKGFKPKSPQNWNLMDWSGGCVRHKPLSCSDKNSDGFVKLEGLKLPDTAHTWVDETMSLEECREKCLNNCSCMAYTNSDIRGKGSGCAMWFGDLIDIRQFAADGQDLYLRMPASELEAERVRKKKLVVIISTIIAAILGILSLLSCYYICKVGKNMSEKSETKCNNEDSEEDPDLPLVDLSTINVATEYFSVKNKIGEGGFGIVYKGRLVSGQDIAVKKLSRSSGQGVTEFKNEVKLIAKLQHRNLVKLLGFCIQGEEKILIYEYMPNGSLDSFIFDCTKSKLLDWPRRFQIICGIARGLLYLHQDSRLIIIHRDLKTSNVLLDDKLNPKISDFGMAKTFRGEQIEGSTQRVVGTYGYMAPEYVVDGLFSMKSDVFSFGILLLEIISGKRNRRIYHADHAHNLVSHAWMLWKEGSALELIDKNMESSCIIPEALRCIHISLLCAQQHPKDRPNMSSVVLMLGSEIELAEPKQPGYFPSKVSVEADSSAGQQICSSTNEITFSLLDAR